MRLRLSVPRTVLLLAIAVAVAAVLFAGRIGNALGKSADSVSAALPTAKSCPTGAPDDCRDLFAGRVNIDATELPTFAAKTAALVYDTGRVIVSKDGSPPVLALDYSTVDATPTRTFQILIAPRAVPKDDHRSIGTTRGGNEYRAARGSVGTTGLVFFDEHFSYIVIEGGDVELDKTPGALTLAQQLVDAVHLSTRRLDP